MYTIMALMKIFVLHAIGVYQRKIVMSVISRNDGLAISPHWSIMKCGTFPRKLLKFSAYFICVALFFHTLLKILSKYLDQPTATSVQFELRNSIPMPGLTFCSGRAYKTRGKHYNEEAFIANTFKRNEIFGNRTLTTLKNGSQIQVKETRSVWLGLCQTLIFKREDIQGKDKFDRVFVGLRRDNDVKVFVHEPGDEFWLIRGLFPRPFFDVELLAKSKPWTSLVDLRFQLSESTIVNKVKLKPKSALSKKWPWP